MNRFLDHLKVRFFDDKHISHTFADIGKTLSDEDRQLKGISYLKSLHAKQIVMCDIPLTATEIKYEYTTNRGNRKTGTKLFVFNSPNPQQNHEAFLMGWVKRYNKENPHRAMSNVKFLDADHRVTLSL